MRRLLVSLIENASAQGLHTEGTTFPEAFPIKASDYTDKWIGFRIADHSEATVNSKALATPRFLRTTHGKRRSSDDYPRRKKRVASNVAASRASTAWMASVPENS